MFVEVCKLIPKAEHVTKLLAVCASCGADAAFSRRTTEETAVEVIGGADKYLPLCRRCYHMPLPKLQASMAEKEPQELLKTWRADGGDIIEGTSPATDPAKTRSRVAGDVSPVEPLVY